MSKFKDQMVAALKEVMGGGSGSEMPATIKGGTVNLNHQQLNQLTHTINDVKKDIQAQLGATRGSNDQLKGVADKLDEVSKALKGSGTTTSGKTDSADMKKIAELLQAILDELK